MKKQIITALAVLAMVGLAQAATIEWDFDDADGVVDVNTFTGVTAGEWTPDVDAGEFAFQNSRAESGMRTDGAAPTPYPVNSFTITIPAGVTADLTELSFDVGFNETFHPNTKTPGWSLAISQGTTSDPDMSGNLPLVEVAGYTFESKVITLTGLTGLTDTTVTFDFTLTIDAGNNNLGRANTMDNVVLTGTAIPEPATLGMVALFGGGILFIRRKLMM